MGLLAKATAYLEQKQNLIEKSQLTPTNTNEKPAPTNVNQNTSVQLSQANNQINTTTATKTKKKTKRHLPKLRKLAMSCLVGLTLQSASTFNLSYKTIDWKMQYMEIEQNLTQDPQIEKYIESFQKGLKSRVSNQERDLLARMLYGEAGRGVDPFEVLHTVLNRMSSPLFKGSITEIVTAKNQYVGYRAENPVTPAYRRMVDIVVEDWEANGCQHIDGCNHYYFVTGIPSVCNKFEISADPQGAWVPSAKKQYEKLLHYCDVAQKQAERYFNEVHQHEVTR